MPFFSLGLLILVQACTGQKPAELKNSTTPRYAVKGACSNMVFEGQVLSKKNILNILDCSGWNKQYPELTRVLKSANTQSIDRTFKLVNETFFSDKNKRKSLFGVIANAQSAGEMDSLASLLEETLSEHDLMGQIHRALNSENLNQSELLTLMKVVSVSNEENTKTVKALKNTLRAYEDEKQKVLGLFDEDQKEELIQKASVFITDLSKNMDEKSWRHLSGILYSGDSAIQDWAKRGANGDLGVLLKIIKHPTFYEDVSFLKDKIDNGISCKNRASERNFVINVGQELKHKIESLKIDEKDAFEKTLLHGLTKYLAFQEFCEEKESKQGIDSFFLVMYHAFNVLPSDHDYEFLKRIHQIFNDDRFVLLSFLSSKSFASLRDLLVDLGGSGSDEDLVRSLYVILSNVPKEDLANVASLVMDLSQDESQIKSWYHSWSKLWVGMSPSERKGLIRLLGVTLSDKTKTFQILSLAEKILRTFPEFTPKLAAELENDSFQKDLIYLVSLLTEEKVQKELASFLSERGFFEFVKIVTQETKKPGSRAMTQADRPNVTLVNYFENPKSREVNLTRTCFNTLTEQYRNDNNYYQLVNSLPQECLAILGQVGFVGNIYLWMNSSDHYFRQTYQVGDFHSATGVWAPGMLQFIFSAAVKADFVLASNDGKTGIKDNLDEIHRTATHPAILESFHQLSQVYLQADQLLKFDQRLINFITTKDDSQLSQIGRDALSLTAPTDSYVSINIRPNSCSDISPRLGVDPCLTQKEKEDNLLGILRTLKRKNEKGDSLVMELVKWIHPQGGIALPFRKKKTREHKATIDEVIRFLFDLSSEKTTKTFVYRNKNSSEVVRGNVLDRLEVVIRDISFLNNFYGAYFKNSVAGASDYRDEVVESEKLLAMLERGGGLFRGTNTMPDDSKYRLKNVRATYSSLVELSDDFVQPDGSSRTYGPFIQSLLAAIGNSSKLSTQTFNAYRVPKEKIVEGHNGVFLTQFVQISGLRSMSQFVRSRFDSELSALNTADFKQINNNLIGRHELTKIQSSLQLILDKYLDHDRNQLNLMIKDAVTLFSGLKDDEQKILEEIAVKAMILLSDKRLDQQNIEKMASFVELSIELWPEISEILHEIKNRKSILKLVNQFMDNMVTKPEITNRLLDVLITSELFKADDLRLLMAEAEFRQKLKLLMNQLAQLDEVESTLNWHEVIEAIISGADMKWDPIKDWLRNSSSVEKQKLSISLLISVLGEKNQDQYRLKMIMDELFLNHRNDLLQFLSETFKSLELKPD